MATTDTAAGAALDALYRRHAAEVYRYAYAVLGNRSDAEDVTQTTFVNALRALERGEQPRTPSNWLITIAHNLIRQRFRQKAARPREVELDREVAAPAVDEEGPSLEELVRALQRIPESQREALVLRELEGRSYKEIAGILGVSVTALETLIFRARRSLAEELENLVTCDRAELALSRRLDGRLGLKERRRLSAHLAECESCARIAASSRGRRGAFKALAAVPLPLSLTLAKGAPSASAAGAGIAAKLAAGAAAIAVAGGGAYEGTKLVTGSDSARPARTTPAEPRVIESRGVEPPPPTFPRPVAAGLTRQKPKPKVKPAPAKKAKAPKVKAAKARAAKPVRGKSATAPGKLRAKPPQAAKRRP